MEKYQLAWAPGWESRVHSGLVSLGYQSIRTMMKDRPTSSYRQLAEALGGVAPIQVVWFKYADAQERGYLGEALIDGLVRNLRAKCSEGWMKGPSGELHTAMALGYWVAEVEEEVIDPRCGDKATEVVKRLKSISPPVGWLPDGPDDPLILEAFECL